MNYTGAVVSVSVGAGGGGGGIGSGGEGGGPPIDYTPELYFETQVKEDLVTNCAGATCHSVGELAFLLSGQEYAAISGYKTKFGIPLLVENPEESALITFPANPDHPGGPWDGLEDLKNRVLIWLAMEAEDLPPFEPTLELGPISPNGWVNLPLDSMGPEFAGSALVFYAKPYGTPTSLLELSELAIYPASGTGLRIKDITVTVHPGEGQSSVSDSTFNGDPQDYVAPQQVSIGGGTLVLTVWNDEATLSIQFGEIRALLADDAGNLFGSCTNVDVFTAAVDKDPSKGPLYCAEQCHGGQAGPEPTTQMNLAPLLTSPRDDAFACAVMRKFIVPTNVSESRIIKATDPVNFINGPGLTATETHPYHFVYPEQHEAFKQLMAPWIDGE